MPNLWWWNNASPARCNNLSSGWLCLIKLIKGCGASSTVQSWASVADAGPTLNRRRGNCSGCWWVGQLRESHPRLERRSRRSRSAARPPPRCSPRRLLRMALLDGRCIMASPALEWLPVSPKIQMRLLVTSVFTPCLVESAEDNIESDTISEVACFFTKKHKMGWWSKLLL